MRLDPHHLPSLPSPIAILTTARSAQEDRSMSVQQIVSVESAWPAVVQSSDPRRRI